MQNLLTFETAFKLFTYLLILWISLSVHEYAHGWVARNRGDRTAELSGRLTLNPFAHIDMLGTVILPILSFLNPSPFHLFGWAKPVPVDNRYLKDPRRDLFWIAAAGPLSNVILAVMGTVGLAFFLASFGAAVQGCQANLKLGCNEGTYEVYQLLLMFIMLNISLAVLNLIPVHPLDGGKVLARFLSPRAAAKFEEMEPQLAIGLLIFAFFGGLSYILGPPVRFFASWLGEMAFSLSRMIS